MKDKWRAGQRAPHGVARSILGWKIGANPIRPRVAHKGGRGVGPRIQKRAVFRPYNQSHPSKGIGSLGGRYWAQIQTGCLPAAACRVWESAP